MLTAYALAALIGYLLGSFPTGYLVGRFKGVDIRQHGSGNIGATNVVRVLGKGPGFLVFGCDALKGWLAARVGTSLGWDAALRSSNFEFSRGDFGTLPAPFLTVEQLVTLGAILAAIACILGHNFPVWLHFRGGKGIATSAGVLLGLMPWAVLVGVVVWAAAFFTLRYVSVASLLAGASLPITVGVLWRTGRANGALFAFSVLAAALAWWRHRANLQRLRAGTEPRFARKTKGER